jgi:hypothetical protein
MDRRWWIVGGALLVAVVLWVGLVPMHASEGSTQPSEPVEQPSAAQPAEPSAVPDTAEAPAQEQPSPASAAKPPAPTPRPPTAAPANGAQPALAPVPAPAGPVAKLKGTFETEPRDSAATAVEAKIASTFGQPGFSPGLLRSILCRKSVCRVTVTWSRERATSYMGVFMRLVLEGDFDHEMATEPVGELNGSGQQELNVYLVRASSAAAAPPG